jgi:predicted ATPase
VAPPLRQILRSLELRPESSPDRQAYPFSIPALRALERLDLDAEVTFLVGENGSGKSTLLEAIAVAAGVQRGGRRPESCTGRDAAAASRACSTSTCASCCGARRERGGFFSARRRRFFNVVDRGGGGYASRYGWERPARAARTARRSCALRRGALQRPAACSCWTSPRPRCRPQRLLVAPGSAMAIAWCADRLASS